MSKAIIIPRIIAHRGASSIAPENTLIAMQLAAEMGARAVEFDVSLTKDEEAIVLHDETLQRTTNGKGKVAKTTLQQIKKLDAGSWFAPPYAGMQIPTFAETLRFIATQPLQMNIEIKPTPNCAEITAEKVVQILHRYPPKKTPLISSFKMQSLRTVYALDKNLPLAWLTHSWRADFEKILEKLHCVSLNINQHVLTKSRVQAVKKAGYYLLTYTVDDPKRAEQLFAWGVDGIFTNVPQILCEIIA
jgi:glycerophosphoryl diester phosphodiesterase